MWNRKLRKRKIFILGKRSGTSLLHKCLLITGLINWGVWSLHTYESEPQIKFLIHNKYPNITKEMIKPNYKFEIAKSPAADLIMPIINKLYPQTKYIIMERDADEIVESFITGFGESIGKDEAFIYDHFNSLPNIKVILEKEIGYYPDNCRDFLTVWFKFQKDKREEFLVTYNKDLILRIEFNDLINDFENIMKKVCDFVHINYDIYKNLWREMRNIKHMVSKKDFNKNYERKGFL